jgi:hypothetical protein
MFNRYATDYGSLQSPTRCDVSYVIPTHYRDTTLNGHHTVMYFAVRCNWSRLTMQLMAEACLHMGQMSDHEIR